MKYQAKPVVVDAFLITGVEPKTEHGSVGVILDNGMNVSCDQKVLARYHPAVGDYLVIQEDGYFYINPSDVFERKYEPHVPKAARTKKVKSDAVTA